MIAQRKQLSPLLYLILIALLCLGILLALAAWPADAEAQEFDCSTVTDVPATECEALVAFFEATGGTVDGLEDWKEKDGWLVSTEVCTWFGVKCSAAGDHVTELGFSFNNLNGSIPREIVGLTELEFLDLYANGLNGQLPNNLDQLQKLWYLNLRDNNITGPIPPALANAPALRELDLYGNDFNGGVPGALSTMTQLETLILGGNGLTGGIPGALKDLKNLKQLHLGSNQLEGSIPADLAQLSKLEYLYLQDNQLSGEIPDLSGLQNLTFLSLNSNALTGQAPAWLCSLDMLLSFSLDYNSLDTEEVPDCLNDPDMNDWKLSQTVPPKGPGATTTTPGTAIVSWTPIEYIRDVGYYEILMATDNGAGLQAPEDIAPDAPNAPGTFVPIGQTDSKEDASFAVDNLDPNATYYFKVRTVTPAHELNQNDLVSEPTTEISITPTAISLLDMNAGTTVEIVPLLLALLFAGLLATTASLLTWRHAQRQQAKIR